MAKKFFYRGLKEKYDAVQHSNALYVTTDTHELIAGGITVGIDPEQMQEILDFMDSKGQANGLATLDENGKIPVSQLNGQLARVQGVDMVVTSTTLPGGISAEYMVWCTDDKKFREYNGTSWEVVEPAPDTIYNFRNSDVTGDTSRTNILYRWDGQNLTEISESLAIGETAGTAYEGSKGKALADHLDTLQSDVTYLADTVIPEMNENTAKALDMKVDWDETKTVISLPANGSISAIRGEVVEGEVPEGGNLLAQRTYDEGVTYVTEVGTTKNKLTLNATERPQIDIAGGSSEKMAFESDLDQLSHIVNIPIRTLKDQVYDQTTILGWFGVADVTELKDIISTKGIQYLKYGLSLSYNPHYYKMPIQYAAFESANQIKLVAVGLDTTDDSPVKYEIVLNLDGTVFEGTNSNVKLIMSEIATISDIPTDSNINKLIEAYIVQELGNEALKVISQQVITSYINNLTNRIQNIEDKVGEDSVSAQIQEAVDALKGGVSAEYDTLQKLLNYIQTSDASTLASANTYTDESLQWYDVE